MWRGQSAQAGDDADELLHRNQPTVSLPRTHTHVHDLHPQLNHPFSQSEALPESSETHPHRAPSFGAGEGVDADGGAHLLEGMSEVGILPDFGAMGRCEGLEMSAEGGELGVESGERLS